MASASDTHLSHLIQYSSSAIISTLTSRFKLTTPELVGDYEEELTGIPKAFRMFILHIGHVRWSCSHGSTQCLWKTCLTKQDKSRQTNDPFTVHGKQYKVSSAECTDTSCLSSDQTKRTCMVIPGLRHWAYSLQCKQHSCQSLTPSPGTQHRGRGDKSIQIHTTCLSSLI